MGVKEYEFEAKYCARCSFCKWIPLNKIRSWRFSQGCPAIARYNLHAYSGGGRLIAGLSLALDRSELSEELADIVYKCQMCGLCQVSCHLAYEIPEPFEMQRELRHLCVERGMVPPELMLMRESLRKEDNPFGEPKARRGEWAEGLGLKNVNEERAEILLHAGCRASYDQEYREILRGAAGLLKEAGVDVGIAGREEACCGGRIFDAGYRGELEKYADDMVRRVEASGAEVLVTPCADCYGTFRYYYPMVGKSLGVRILHLSQLVEELLQEGKINPGRLSGRVTYHDPCHLGRLGEEYLPWKGKTRYVKYLGQVIVPEPSKPRRVGSGGVYEAPRSLLRGMGLEVVEMERRREWSWCCGAGGGMLEVHPDFAQWTALQRLEEAEATGAEVLVTSCPWCLRNLKDTAQAHGKRIQVSDLTELVLKAVEGRG